MFAVRFAAFLESGGMNRVRGPRKDREGREVVISSTMAPITLAPRYNPSLCTKLVRRFVWYEYQVTLVISASPQIGFFRFIFASSPWFCSESPF